MRLIAHDKLIMRKPTFLFLGPDKSGSTWIHELLMRHPQVYVPETKDLWFFDRFYDRGMEWYLRAFAGAGTEHQAVGEVTHNYLFSGAAAERIRRALPDVKLVVSLRDPVERLFSHYLFMIRSGRTRLPLAQALDEFPELIGNSSYGRCLQRYLALFPPEQLLVLWFDELQRDPRAYGAKLCEGLGVQALPHLPYGQEVQKASRPRSFLLAGVARHAANGFRAARLERVVGRVKRSFLMSLLYREYGRADRPTMDPDTRNRVAAALREDQVLLKNLLRRPSLPWEMDAAR